MRRELISESDGRMNSSKEELQSITEEGRLEEGRDYIKQFLWRKVSMRMGSCLGVVYGRGHFWFRPCSWSNRRWIDIL